MSRTRDEADGEADDDDRETCEAAVPHVGERVEPPQPRCSGEGEAVDKKQFLLFIL